MRTRTASETRYVHRYFHAETGACLRESEARKLPGKSVIVETIRVPGKYGNTDVQKVSTQKLQAGKRFVILHQIKNTITTSYNRLKVLLHFVGKSKSNGGLFDVKHPLEGLTPQLPFAITREINVVNSTATKGDAG